MYQQPDFAGARSIAPAGLPIACSACGLWAQGCRHALMPGVGPRRADLMVVGEYPGYAEDMHGQPWVGPAGQYLRGRLAAHGISPDRVFFTNAIRCKPANTDFVTTANFNACRGFVEEEFRTVAPKVLMVVGLTAITSLLKQTNMNKARTVVHTYGGVPAIASYNPVNGFRDPSYAFAFERDLVRVGRALRGELVRPQSVDYKVCRTLAEVRAGLADLRRQAGTDGPTTCDIETSPKYPWQSKAPRILSFGMSARPGTAYIFPWGHQECLPDPREQVAVWAEIKAFLEDPTVKLVFQNGIFDVSWLLWFGIRPGCFWGDTMIAATLLDNTEPSQSLVRLVWDETDMGDYWTPLDSYIEGLEDEQKKANRARATEIRDVIEAGEYDDDEEREELADELETLGDVDVTYDRIPWSMLGPYQGYDADATLRIWLKQEPRCREMGVLDCLQQIYCPSSVSFAWVQCNGARYNNDRVASLSYFLAEKEREMIAKVRSLAKVRDYEGELAKRNDAIMEARAAKRAQKGIRLTKRGEDGYLFNPSSPAQLADFFYRFLDLPAPKVSTKNKRKDSLTTSVAALSILEKKTVVAKYIKRLRKIQKTNKTYFAPQPKWIGVDGNVHTNIFLTGAATGRPSMRNPNLANIPREVSKKDQDIEEAEWGWVIPSVKSVWESRFGSDGLIGECDLSQIEVRIAALFSKDENLLEIYQSDGDIYRETAARIKGCTAADIDDDTRQQYKRLILATQYDAQAEKVAEIARCDVETAREFLLSYERMFPGVRRYKQDRAKEVCSTGMVWTATGQPRRLWGAYGQYHRQYDGAVARVLRQAGNMPIQGTAAHITHTAVNRLREIFWKYELRSLIIMEIYDSIVLDIWKPELTALARIVPTVMTSLRWPWLNIKLKAEFKAGPTWAEAKEVRLS